MQNRNGLVFSAVVASIIGLAAAGSLMGWSVPAPAVEPAPVSAPAPVVEKDIFQQQAENATAAAALTPNKEMIAFVIGTQDHMCNDVTEVRPTDKPKVYRVTCHAVEGAIATHDFIYDEPGNKITAIENNG